MGMSLATWLDLTPGQFLKALEAFREMEARKAERNENHAWQVARWQVWRTLAPPNQKQISVFDLLELPGDAAIKQTKTARPSSKERFEELKQKWD